MTEIKSRIAIDGPSAAGKSTIAKELAKELSIDYIDTGAMYRAIAYQISKNSIDLEQTTRIAQLLSCTEIDFMQGTVYLNGVDVNREIRTQEMAGFASQVAAIPMVREKLVSLQRSIGESKSVVMDGRDIGTNVLPFAEWKFFLSASAAERAKRRFLELREKGQEASLSEILKDIEDRDDRDRTRAIDPLRKADDAIEIDTTGLTVNETLQLMLERMRGNE